MRPATLSNLPQMHAFRCSRPGPASIYLASQPTVTGTVHTARISYLGCTLRTARLNDDCRPHPTTVAAAPHYPHTRPPDVPARLVYQRPLVNTYRTSDLCRPPGRARPPSDYRDRRAFALTRSGAGVDLPGFGRGRSDMSDREDDAPAARGALGSRARRTADRDDDRHRPWRKSDFPSDDAAFERCRVKSHEDFPRHIYRLFLVLGIQFRWVLTRGPLARALVPTADLAIDDAKENAWMALYEHDRDTLEDILYRRLQDLWAPLTDAMKVFDTHGSAQQLCAQKVWEALLTAFPLDHKRMQTVLLAREIARMMRWDGDSKGAVNRHFASVTELHRTMGYIGNLSIEDVLKSVLMATLKASTNRSLCDAYHKVLDDLDDDKDLSFALIQDACARQFRRHPDERHPAAWSRDPPGTPRRTQGPPGAPRTAFNKTRPQPGAGVSALLCNFLDDHGVKPVKVLKKAGLRHDTQADWHSGDAVHALYMASQRFMPQTLHTDSEGASADDASDEQPALVDSDSDAS
jgi:hypothetical protein